MKKFFIAIIALMATSCSIAKIEDTAKKNYEVEISFYNPRIQENSITRYSLVTLKNNTGQWVEEQIYKEEYQLNFFFSAEDISREAAERNNGRIFESWDGYLYDSLEHHIDGLSFGVSVELVDCTPVYLETTNEWLYHPDFPQETPGKGILSHHLPHPRKIRMEIEGDYSVFYFYFSGSEKYAAKKIKIK